MSARLHVADANVPTERASNRCAHCGRLSWPGEEDRNERWVDGWEAWRTSPERCSIPRLSTNLGQLGFALNPPPPRPSAKTAVPGAALALAETVCKEFVDLGTPEDFARDIVACHPTGTEDALGLAKALENRSRYDVDLEFVEALEGWSYAVMSETDRLVSEWAATHRLATPFEGTRRVSADVGGETVKGLAYFNERSIAQATCYLAQDGKPPGQAWIVPWERVRDPLPLDVADEQRDAERKRREEASEHGSRRSREERARQIALDDAARAASKSMPEADDEVASRLSLAAQRISTAFAEGRQVEDDDLATAMASLNVLAAKSVERSVAAKLGARLANPW